MSGLAVFAVEVGPVAVLVPPGPFVRQGTVSDSDVIVSVFRGEGPALMVAQRITWDRRRDGELETSADDRQHWHMAVLNNTMRRGGRGKGRQKGEDEMRERQRQEALVEAL